MIRRRILSIDGGGRRGYMPAVMLADLEAAVGPLHEFFSDVAGTSTGAILAAGVAAGVPASEMVRFYEDECSTIFVRSFWHKLRTLWGLIGPKYPITALKTSLERHFAPLTLGGAYTDVMLTSYDLQTRRPHMFKSWREADQDVSLAYAALASAAAPTYFPAVDGHLVDGGVFASNPAMCLLTDVCERFPDNAITMVSLGTGVHEDGVTDGPGLIGWAPRIADVLLDGTSDAAAYQVKHHPAFRAPGAVLYRMQYDLPDPDTRPMDGPITPALRVLAQRLLQDPEYVRMKMELVAGRTA